MTTPTTIHLRFTPTQSDAEFADHQQVQAAFSAAKLLGDWHGLGQAVVILPRGLYQRAKFNKWREDGPASILGHLSEAFGVSCAPEDDSEIAAMGQTARFQDAALESLHKRLDEATAQIKQLEGNLEIKSEHLNREHLLTLDLEVQVEEERLRVKAAEHALELSREQVAALASKIASTAALGVLDVLTPPPDLAPPHRVRVVMHGPDILRVLVATETEQAVLEEVEVEVGEKFGDALGYDSLVVVQREPGEPAPGYVLRGGEASGADAPTLRWYWRHDAEDAADEQGPLEESDAIDATWDQFATDAVEEEAEEDDADGAFRISAAEVLFAFPGDSAEARETRAVRLQERHPEQTIERCAAVMLEVQVAGGRGQ